MERLRNKRHDFVNSLRTKTPGSPGSPSSSQEYVNQVMLEEWQQMKLESPLLSGNKRGFKRKNVRIVYFGLKESAKIEGERFLTYSYLNFRLDLDISPLYFINILIENSK